MTSINNKKVAVVLSGCGFLDGSEVNETILSLLSIERHGCEWQAFAPDIVQTSTANYLDPNSTEADRNVLSESARIVRGKIKDISKLKVEEFDAILFPGGYGAANNLTNFLSNPKQYYIIPQVENVVDLALRTGIPMAFLCIAPIIIAKIAKKCRITIGNNPGVAESLNLAGANHVSVDHADAIIVDDVYKIVTAPCYMFDTNLATVFSATEKVVSRLVEFMNK